MYLAIPNNLYLWIPYLLYKKFIHSIQNIFLDHSFNKKSFYLLILILSLSFQSKNSFYFTPKKIPFARCSFHVSLHSKIINLANCSIKDFTKSENMFLWSTPKLFLNISALNSSGARSKKQFSWYNSLFWKSGSAI